MLEYEIINILEGIDVLNQIYQKNAIFVTIGILKILILNMNLIFVMGVMI